MLEKGAELELIDLNKGLSVEQLDKLIGKRDYRLFLNTRNAIYRERNMKLQPPARQEALELMAANPNLIKRPIVVAGRKTVLGFDPESLGELIRA